MVARLRLNLTPYITLLAVAIIAGLLALDIWQGARFNATVIYPTILLACWWARDRRVLWALCTMCLLCAVAAQLIEPPDQRAMVHRILLSIGLVVTTVIFDHLLLAWDEMVLRQNAMEASVQEVAAHEVEIARANEKLQSQTEELERQRLALSDSNSDNASRTAAWSSMINTVRMSRQWVGSSREAITLFSVSRRERFSPSPSRGGPGWGWV